MKEVSLKSIIEVVNDNIENTVLNIAQADDDLSQLGMDSITFIRIIVALEETFEIEVPDEKLLITEMGTLNKMLLVILTAVEHIGEQEESVLCEK